MPKNLLHQALWLSTDGHCFYCGHIPPETAQTTDHVIPWVHGGRDDFINIVPACSSCNSIKSAKSLLDFKRRLSSDLNYLFWFQKVNLLTPLLQSNARELYQLANQAAYDVFMQNALPEKFPCPSARQE